MLRGSDAGSMIGRGAPVMSVSRSAFVGSVEKGCRRIRMLESTFKLLCYTTFGVAGQQALSDILIPLHFFSTEPTKADLNTDITGAPLHGEFTYSRRPLTP